MAKFLSHIFLSRVNDYIILYYRAYGNLYHIGENLFREISSVAGMSEIFFQQKFSTLYYIHNNSPVMIMVHIYRPLSSGGITFQTSIVVHLFLH